MIVAERSRPKYNCRCCEQNAEIKIATLAASISSKSSAAARLLSQYRLIISELNNGYHRPFNLLLRLEAADILDTPKSTIGEH